MPQIGPLEIIVVAAIALIVFGPDKLPEIARTIGRAMSELRRMASEVKDEFDLGLDGGDDEDEGRPAAANRRPHPNERYGRAGAALSAAAAKEAAESSSDAPGTEATAEATTDASSGEAVTVESSTDAPPGDEATAEAAKAPPAGDHEEQVEGGSARLPEDERPGESGGRSAPDVDVVPAPMPQPEPDPAIQDEPERPSGAAG